MHRLLEIAVLLLLLRKPTGNAVPLSSFYPYGNAINDTLLPPNDDGSSPAITLPTPFLFYGTYYSTIYVNNNGDLSFGQSWSGIIDTFPIFIPLVAVYQADVDTRGTGSVWYRHTQNTTLLAMVAGNITSITGTTFKPQWLLIATWDHVGYYPLRIDKTNTFQVILTTDGVKSYAIFLYADGLIQWPSYGAQVGFNAGDNVNYANIPGSRTPNILNITSLSNVGVGGQWMFLISRGAPSCGVIYNYTESTLFAGGFVKCYDQPYSSYTSASDLAACNDSQIVFVGAKNSSSSTLISIGAFGSSNVFSITRSTTTAYYDIGGAYWYRYPSYSFGFANTSSVNLYTCDVGIGSNDCAYRLCWHLDQLDGGWRAGCVTWLNGDQTWRKVIYKGDSISATCKSDLDECSLGISGCSQICTNIIGSYMCSCYLGYQISSDNRTCVDVNECSLSISGCSQICTNAIGSYMCSCYPGYQISSDNRTCVDVNECSLSISGCSQICTNAIGSYMCSCYPGYQISSDNRTCVDVNECSLSISGCSQICNNTIGSYMCSCYPGYQISSDNRTCADINECVLGTSTCSEVCNNANGTYVCSCNTGYQLSMDNKSCSDIDECVLGISGCEQTCNNTNGSFLCGCNRGYRLHSNEKNCTDINECVTDTSECNQVCTNTIGGYICDCHYGYVLLPDDKTCSKDPKNLLGAVNSTSTTAAIDSVSSIKEIGITVAICAFTILCCFFIVFVGYKLLARKITAFHHSRNITQDTQGIHMSHCEAYETVEFKNSRTPEDTYVVMNTSMTPAASVKGNTLQYEDKM